MFKWNWMIAVWAAGNLAILVTAGVLAPFRGNLMELSAAEGAMVLGGADYWTEDDHDCDGHPQTCNGDAGVCDQGEQGGTTVWRCHNRGKERYEDGTWHALWFTCETTSGEGVDLVDTFPESDWCYKIWTCPEECKYLQGEMIHVCQDGTDSEKAGIHPNACYIDMFYWGVCQPGA